MLHVSLFIAYTQYLFFNYALILLDQTLTQNIDKIHLHSSCNVRIHSVLLNLSSVTALMDNFDCVGFYMCIFICLCSCDLDDPILCFIHELINHLIRTNCIQWVFVICLSPSEELWNIKWDTSISILKSNLKKEKKNTKMWAQKKVLKHFQLPLMLTS